MLGLIPARGGSKGVPGKNLRPLGGMPLIAHTIRTARASLHLSDVVVTTDDDAIARVAIEHGANVPFLRPASLAADDTPMEPVIQHAVTAIEARRGARVDVVVLLVPTNPFRTSRHIDEGVRLLLDTRATSAVSLVREEYPASWLQTIVEGIAVPLFGPGTEVRRRQEAPPVYKRNDGFFICRRENIMDRGTILDPEARAYVMAPEHSIDIDTEWDFMLAEWLMSRRGQA